MKKFLASLYVLVFMFGLVGTGSAILFADIKSSGITLSEGPLTGLITPTGYSYSHEMPDDTRGLPNVVNRPTLTISDWNSGDSLDVTISAIGSWDDGQLDLASSTIITNDYTDTAVSFSEPATMLLFGFGLIGLARFGRKKLSQKTLTLEHLSPVHADS